MDPATNTPAARSAWLKERSNEASLIPNVATTRVEIEGETTTLPHFKVDIDFPLYRLENGRTQRKQREYLHQHPDNPDLFRDSKYEVEAQRVQGEILENMGSESKLDQLLLDGQKEPLLLTSTGFVLNGNRRLAALRKQRRDSDNDVTRGYVDVVVLPSLPPKELSAIETRLQMAEEGKAPYHWLDQLLKIEHDINEYDFTEKDIARQMNSQVRTIQSLRRAKTLVDRYLEWRGWDSQYFRLDQQEQAFETLAKKHRTFDDSPDTQSAFLEYGFAVIKEPPKGKSVHVEITDIAKNIHNLIQQPSESLNIAKDATEAKPGLIGELTKTVAKPSTKPKTAALIREQLAVAKDKSAVEDALNLPVNNSRQANSLLAAIEISEQTKQLKQVKGQLQGIVNKAEDLIDKINKLPGK